MDSVITLNKLKKQLNNFQKLALELEKAKTNPILLYFFYSSIFEQLLKTAIHTQLLRIEKFLEKSDIKLNADDYFKQRIEQATLGRLMEEIKIFTKLSRDDFVKKFKKQTEDILKERNNIAHHLLDQDIEELNKIVSSKIKVLIKSIDALFNWNIDLLEKYYDFKKPNN